MDYFFDVSAFAAVELLLIYCGSLPFHLTPAPAAERVPVFHRLYVTPWRVVYVSIIVFCFFSAAATTVLNTVRYGLS